MRRPIYMDHHATTPLDPDVLAIMTPYLLGEKSRRAEEEAVEIARGQVARLIGATPEEIRFTGGATESDNIAIKGVARALRDRGRHIVTCNIEHKAVMDTCHRLEEEGFSVTYLPVDAYGMLDPKAVEDTLTPETILITLIHGHNEIGTINPIREIGQIAKKHGVLFHSDAVQTVGKIPVHVDDLGVDLLSVSAHKIYGPKGIGALYVRRKSPEIHLAPLTVGEPLSHASGIVGLGTACVRCATGMEEEEKRLTRLRNRLYQGLLDRVDDIFLNGHPTQRLPANLNVSFAFIEGGSLLLSLRDIAVSSGSACTSRTTVDPSYVLLALGRDETLAQSALRFGLGRANTEEEIDYAVEIVSRQAKKLRSLSTHYRLRPSHSSENPNRG
ncbi:MAG: cysteine desulfurase [candidate division Zixibacteria bacterium]|nr:cysteine desulfurase [candidate division Zixibacteria bacterium]